MRNQVKLEPGLVLHKRPYRESSLLLEVLTASHGRIGLVARGARRRSSNYRQLESFSPLLLSWSRRGELGTLTGVETQGQPFGLRKGALLSGLYLNELLVRSLHRDDPHPELFDAYVEALSALGQDGPLEPTLRTFEKHLLAELGYGLVLMADARTGEPVVEHEGYIYVAEQGPVKSDPKAQGVKVSGKTLLALSADSTCMDSQVLAEAKQLMRYLIAHNLGDKPLMSREIFSWKP